MYETRYYQTEALSASRAAFGRRVVRQIIGIPTGTGKTVILAQLLDKYRTWLRTFPATHRRMIVVAHREELLDQAADKILRANPTLRVDIEQANKHASDEADVIVASVQTLSARKGRRLQAFDPARVRVLAIDECHHAVAASYRRVIEHFGLLPPESFRPVAGANSADEALTQQRARLLAWDASNPTHDRLLLGLTATPSRGDRVGLEAVFQSIVYTKTIQEMIREKFLCRLRALRIESLASLDEVSVRGGDFDIRQLGRIVNVITRNKLSVQAYRAHAMGRRAVVFCVDVAHAHLMANTFQLDGVDAKAIDGSMSSETRKTLLRDFREHRFPVLCNCQILTEGWDDPGVSCIIHARPTKSSLLYIQMTGRGTRTHPGKEDCLIIDVVDATKRHSLVTLPTLFGLPVGFDFEGGDALDLADEVDALQEGRDDDLMGLTIEDIKMRAEVVHLFASTDEFIEQCADYRWCKVDGNYALSIPVTDAGEMYLELGVSTTTNWDIRLHNKGNVRVLASALSLQAGFAWAEKWYCDHLPNVMKPVHRRDAHVMKLILPHQTARLRRYGLVVPPDTTQWTAATMIALIAKSSLKEVAA